MANGRGRFGKKIDTVHWTFGQFSAFALASGGAVAQLVLAAQHLPETLLRMRGEWATQFDGPQAAGVGVRITAGLILVPEGTGTTVLWGPETDGDAPWIWWDVANLLYDEAVTDVIGSPQTSSRARVIDSKAMRKVRNTELQFVVESSALSGSPPTNTAGAVRILAGS